MKAKIKRILPGESFRVIVIAASSKEIIRRGISERSGSVLAASWEQ